MSLNDQIAQLKNKLEQTTQAVERALDRELDRLVTEEGIEGYYLEKDEVNHVLSVRKKGNTAEFLIDVEEYLQASLLGHREVQAFHLRSVNGSDIKNVALNHSDLNRLHSSFTTEIDNLLLIFIQMVEASILGVDQA